MRTSCRLAEDTKRPLRIQSMTARVSGCSVPLGRTTPAGPRSKGSGKSRFRSAPRAFPRTPAANLVHDNAVEVHTSALYQSLEGCKSGPSCADAPMAAPGSWRSFLLAPQRVCNGSSNCEVSTCP